jgi:Tetratricopeptide repeat
LDHDTPASAGTRRESEAVVNARSRMALVAQTQGKRHPDYATALNQLALLLIMQGEPDSAEPLLREAKEIRFEALGANHPDYATNLSTLGGLLWARGELDEAERFLRQAAEIRVSTLGRSHPKSVVSLKSLEQLLETTKREMPGQPGVARPSAPEPPAIVPPTPGPTVVIPGVSPKPAAPLPLPVLTAQKVRAPIRVAAPTIPVVRSPAPTRSGLDLSFEGELTELTRVFDELSQGLTSAARDASTLGALPTDELMERCANARQRFDAMAEAVRASAQDLGVPVDRGSLANLEAMHALVPLLRVAEERKHECRQLTSRAIAVLAQVERLDHPADPAFAPLVSCRDRARTLRERVATLSGDDPEREVIDLAEGRHPFQSLLRLVSADDSLDDIAWADLFDSVESSFGSPLATAVARSRIVARVD